MKESSIYDKKKSSRISRLLPFSVILEGRKEGRKEEKEGWQDGGKKEEKIVKSMLCDE